MHRAHRTLLAALRKEAGNGTTQSGSESYLLSGHPYLDIAVPARRRIARAWLSENRDIPPKEFLALLDSLYAGKTHEEKTLGSLLLGYRPDLRTHVRTTHLDRWLDELSGWAEIDALCQNVFTAEELLARWKEWERFIRKLAKDTNINKRRSALVFLTGPTHRSRDVRLRTLAFEMIEVLKHEKPILITKAISWLLREMVALHRKEVTVYLKEHRDTLPKIALRETERKLTTGRK